MTDELAPLTRAELMALPMCGGPEGHRRYYAQYVNESTIASVVAYFGVATLLGSTDPHLNDIPLRQWDSLCGYEQRGSDVRRFAGVGFGYSHRWAELGDSPSLGSLLCIAKEAARIWIERQPESARGRH